MQKAMRRILGIGLLSIVAAGVTLPWIAGNHALGQTPSAPDTQEVTLGPDHTPTDLTSAANRQQLVADLRKSAVALIVQGQFNQARQTVDQIAKISNDAQTQEMVRWFSDFESQRVQAVEQRHKEFEEALKDVKFLIDKQKDDFALDTAARAYLLADDKEAFRKEALVSALVERCIKLAEGDDQSQKWLKSLRIYSSLGSLEPANPLWKDRLKSTTRRIRLLATYSPDQLKTIQDAEMKERDEVLAMLKPDKAAATQPADRDVASNFEISWKDSLKDIRQDMLLVSMDQARDNYWRAVDYKTLVLGGLKGLDILATTPGLETTFDGLRDPQKLQQFRAAIEDCKKLAENPSSRDDDRLPRQVLARLRAASAASVAIPEEVLISEFADGAFAELDPFTSAIWPSEVEEFNKGTQGTFSGVGIQIETAEDGSLRVVSPLEDSPAYRAGIKAGDVITHIDGKSAKGITLTQAVRTITGPAGTNVTLSVRSQDNTTRDYDLLREKIKVGSVKGWQHLPGGGWNYFVDPENRIGYLRLTNFTAGSADELALALDEMKAKGARAVILDLRYNPGGLLKAATSIVDKFLDGGTIVSTKADRETPNPPSEARATRDGQEFSAPLVVLVNQYSASASEIVSGALKDQHRAIIVGERTFGKGSVQMLFPVSNLGESLAYLKVTTSHYYLPNGRCIHRDENSTEWGVDPDITIALTPEQMQQAIKSRQQMDVLRDANSQPVVTPETKDATTQPTDPIQADPQLGAALLVLRMELAGK